MTERTDLAQVQLEVNPAKLLDYLLSLSHPVGRTKAAYFRALGFRAEAPRELEAALLAHGRENPVASREATRFGSKYVVDGIFRAPNGERVELRSIWFVELGAEVARFVTAYPSAAGRERKGHA